jgi:hypothetical protein
MLPAIIGPWLNWIGSRWVHGKRHVVEPDGLLTAQKLADRSCEYSSRSHEPRIIVPEETASLCTSGVGRVSVGCLGQIRACLPGDGTGFWHAMLLLPH